MSAVLELEAVTFLVQSTGPIIAIARSQGHKFHPSTVLSPSDSCAFPVAIVILGPHRPMRRCCPLLFVNSGWELPAISASSRPQEPPPSKMAAGGNGGLSFSGVVSNSAPSNRGGTVSTSYNYSGGAAVSSPGNQTASAASSAGASPPTAPPPPLPAAAGLLHREPVYNWQATKTTVRERFTFLFNNEVLSDVHFLVGKGLGSQRIPAHRYRNLRLPAQHCTIHSRLVTPTPTAQG